MPSDTFIPFQIPVIRPHAYGVQPSDIPNRLRFPTHFSLGVKVYCDVPIYIPFKERPKGKVRKIHVGFIRWTSRIAKIPMTSSGTSPLLCLVSLQGSNEGSPVSQSASASEFRR
jgi:hypothetical protein